MSWNSIVMYKVICIFFLLPLLSLSPEYATGQKDTGVSEEAFEKLAETLDYSDTKTTIVIRKSEDRNGAEPNVEKRESGDYNGAGLFQILALIVVSGLVLFIIYMVFSKVKVEKGVVEDEEPGEDLDNLEIIDTEYEYLQAVNAGNYRLAIRMQFLKVLKYLNENHFIAWEPKKTNRQYLLEVSNSSRHEFFRKLIFIYEWVWYGNTNLDQAEFYRLNPLFQEFLKENNE